MIFASPPTLVDGGGLGGLVTGPESDNARLGASTRDIIGDNLWNVGAVNSRSHRTSTSGIGMDEVADVKFAQVV